MFKIFGLAGAVLVFVAVHALTADNLLAALAGLCFLALEWWQRKTRAFYKARPAKAASKPEQGASSAPDYKATPSSASC
ncbi:hypothetical protein ACG97_00300 [Vogesella sp. EB]|uniref:hypothetical protein n=1 Tax=Vogesella sp. EB TaxID=1526735 RepID=UPI00064CFD09|nr:hypothetical protein [Vogesella sp. EB]KMJ54766.1 hypothetical protein ACG97_00300 [Vogesella sp. EB]